MSTSSRRWVKIWHEILTDSAFLNLSLEQQARFYHLLVYTSQHGEKGTLIIEAPARYALALFQCADFDELVTLLSALPNMQIAKIGHAKISVTIKGWAKYQIDTTACERKRRQRKGVNVTPQEKEKDKDKDKEKDKEGGVGGKHERNMGEGGRAASPRDITVAGEARRPSEEPQGRGEAKTPQRKTSQAMGEEEWLASLQANPLYRTLDVRRMKAKLEAWCAVNGKHPTRRRLVNWLNREDRPLTAQGVKAVACADPNRAQAEIEARARAAAMKTARRRISERTGCAPHEVSWADVEREMKEGKNGAA